MTASHIQVLPISPFVHAPLEAETLRQMLTCHHISILCVEVPNLVLQSARVNVVTDALVVATPPWTDEMNHEATTLTHLLLLS